MFVGIDWAQPSPRGVRGGRLGQDPSPRHGGAHSQDGLDQLVVAWAAGPARGSCWWGSSGRRDGWWTGSWRPATRSCWSPTFAMKDLRAPLHDRGRPSRIEGDKLCASPMWPAPTATGCGA